MMKSKCESVNNFPGSAARPLLVPPSPPQSTAESLLRSALQGKGYGKGPPIPLQNGMSIMASPTSIGKSNGGDDDLRRVMFVTDQVGRLTEIPRKSPL